MTSCACWVQVGKKVQHKTLQKVTLCMKSRIHSADFIALYVFFRVSNSLLATYTHLPPEGIIYTMIFYKYIKKLSNPVFCHLEVEAFAFYAMFHYITLNIHFLRFNNGGTHRKLKISQLFLF